MGVCSPPLQFLCEAVGLPAAQLRHAVRLRQGMQLWPRAYAVTCFCRRWGYKKGERHMSLEHILCEQFGSPMICSILNGIAPVACFCRRHRAAVLLRHVIQQRHYGRMARMTTH